MLFLLKYNRGKVKIDNWTLFIRKNVPFNIKTKIVKKKKEKKRKEKKKGEKKHIRLTEDKWIKTGLENESPGAKCAEIRPASANRPCNGEQLNLKNPDGENNECRSILINCPLQAFTSVVLWFTTFKKLIWMREFSISNVNLPYLPFSK